MTLAVLGSVGIIVVGGHYLTRPMFRFLALAKLPEIFTAAALLLVIGIALLMTVVGLSPALGTFLAGVVLANSEYRHALEIDIEPFKGLLLGLFFIAVGAVWWLTMARVVRCQVLALRRSEFVQAARAMGAEPID